MTNFVLLCTFTAAMLNLVLPPEQRANVNMVVAIVSGIVLALVLILRRDS